MSSSSEIEQKLKDNNINFVKTITKDDIRYGIEEDLLVILERKKTIIISDHSGMYSLPKTPRNIEFAIRCAIGITHQKEIEKWLPAFI